MDLTVYLPDRYKADRLAADLPAQVKVDTSTLAETPFRGLTWLVVLTVPDDSLARTMGPSNVMSAIIRDVQLLGGAIRTPDPA